MRLLLEKLASRRAAPAPRPLPAAAPEVEAQADALPGRIWALFCAQAPAPLEERERRRLAGLLFTGAPQLVRGVADALEEAPGLFAGAAARAARLRRGGRRALFWRALHDSLAAMARLAADSALREEAAAVSEAMAVIEAARQDARDPERPWQDRVGGGEAARRQLALHGALAVLERRERDKRKARKQRARALRAATAAARTTQELLAP